MRHKKLIQLPVLLLLMGAVFIYMGRDPEVAPQDQGMVPEAPKVAKQAQPEPQDTEIHASDIEARKPAIKIEEPVVVALPSEPTDGFRLISNPLKVPISHAFLTSGELPDQVFEIGEGGIFTPPTGKLMILASLTDNTGKVELAQHQKLTTLPERRVQYTNICTLLLDAPAGPLPKKCNVHAAFLSKKGRIKPARILSVESLPGGWIVRIEEPKEFGEEVAIDRALLCIDPPIKDHVRIATWTLTDLRRSKANPLRPLPTHSLPLRWKGLSTMGNMGADQQLGAVFFAGSSDLPGFQSPAALDWLAAPPKRAFEHKDNDRVYHRVPEAITGCTAFFTSGSVSTIPLPHTHCWKFGVELFPDAVARLKSQRDNPALPSTMDVPGLEEPDEIAGALNWVWGEQGQLLHGATLRGDADPAASDSLFAGLAIPDVGAMLMVTFHSDEGLAASSWVPFPIDPYDQILPHWVEPNRLGRFQITNESNWTGEAVLHLVSLDDAGISLRPILLEWPRSSRKRFRTRGNEFAWILTSRTAKGSSGLLGPNLDSHDSRFKSQLKADYDIQLNLELGWSSLLLGELARKGTRHDEFAEKINVKEIYRTRLRDSGDELTAIEAAGTATVLSALSSAPVVTELGPWGIKILSSDAAPSFLELGFPNGPARHIEPNIKTSVFKLLLTRD
ncbi:MAG: hypothetical protein GY930_20180 [bacterium]|nr:hypothetical protein [bacterium]